MTRTAGKRTRLAAGKVIYNAILTDESESEELVSEFDDQPKVENSITKKLKNKSTKSQETRDTLEKEDYKELFLAENDKDDVCPSPNLIIELTLDTYWPSPMNSSEPVNDKLLLVDTYRTCGKDSCDFCKYSKDSIVPLKISTILTLESYRTRIFMSKSTTEDRVGEDSAILSKRFRDALEAHSFYKEKFDAIKHDYQKEQFNDEGYRIMEKFECVKSVGLVRHLYAEDFRCCRFYVKAYESDNEIFKFYCSGNELFVYLDSSVVEDFPSQLSIQCYWRICDNFSNGYFRNGGIKRDHKVELSDTFDFPEAVMPGGFSLKLRDYQLRSLSWMKAVESNYASDHNQMINNFDIRNNRNGCPVKIKFGKTGFYLDPDNHAFSRSSHTTPIAPLRIKGGLLADDTGSGKTITCLALIHAAPFTEEHALQRKKDVINTFPYKVPSRATCVVCPSNLQQQWIMEAKRCNAKLKIIGLACIKDYHGISWNDIMLADLVVVSLQFLTNANYKKASAKVGTPYFEIENNLKVKGTIKLELIQFHRMIFDEIHEMENQSKYCKVIARSLQADYHWGITGTPKFSMAKDIVDIFYYLNIRFSSTSCRSNYMACEELLKKFVKRNIPDLKLPPLTNEVIWVTATPSELVLMRMYSDNWNTSKTIMMCSHFQISESITKVVGEDFMSIKQVETLITKEKLREMEKMERNMDNANSILEKFLKQEEPGQDNKMAAYKFTLSKYQRNLEDAKKKYEVSKSSYTFFINTLKEIKTIENKAERICRICFCEIESKYLAMLPCSHYYCYECITPALEIKRECPFCRFEMGNNKKILRIACDKKKAPKLRNAGIDISKYGSKLIALYNYITDLFEKDPSARVILFLQYSKLADFISKTLSEINIKHVRVTGNVFKRQGAIEKFTNSKDVRLIMLSSEDSVSGINLTQATHVILLHPFWSNKGEEVDLAYEKQGISRAYRGGLSHHLKVVRFAVKDTIEETLTRRRQNIKLY